MAKPDKDTLLGYVKELGLSEALQMNVLQELEADEQRANQFVGQRLRHVDYTRKTQELADQRRQIDVAVTEQVKEYAEKLQEAEGKISKVLKDLETEQISRATAENRLRTIATKYEIPKDDLSDLLKDPPAGAPPKTDGQWLSAEAVNTLMEKREQSLIKKLMPEILSLTQIGTIQQDIRRQHQDFTGKWLSNEEMKELVNAASQDNSGGLVKVWEDKYEIGKIRGDRHDKEVRDKAVAEYQAEQTRKASEDAIRQIHNQDSPRTLSTSPVLREYRDRSKEDGLPGSDNQNGKSKTGAGNGKEPQPRMSGAERAATKFVERRNKGIPLGKEAPAA